jgi:restriction system protein
MPIPKYEQLMLPLLRRTADINGETNVPALTPQLARDFGLSELDLQERLPSGGQTYFTNRCHWAKFYLSRAGLLEGSRRGYFKITPEGRALLANAPKELNRRALMKIPQFADWWNKSPRQSEGGASAAEVLIGDTLLSSTPDEEIDNAAKLLAAALEVELLTRVREVDPGRFEQIVVDLLIAMGFGGGDPAMGEKLGRSGDGGIDGVIREDALGLDAIYVQAKRYQEGSTINAAVLQAFVGSLVGNRATKGVFVTTSKFNAAAKEYVKNITHRVALIDGEELARLLVRHGVGVREDRRIIIKKLDEDYLAE